MSEEARSEADSSSPAFPGKVVVLWAGNSWTMAVMMDCRFERIAGGKDEKTGRGRKMVDKAAPRW
jgi:hypothetical protein